MCPLWKRERVAVNAMTTFNNNRNYGSHGSGHYQNIPTERKTQVDRELESAPVEESILCRLDRVETLLRRGRLYAWLTLVNVGINLFMSGVLISTMVFSYERLGVQGVGTNEVQRTEW